MIIDCSMKIFLY